MGNLLSFQRVNKLEGIIVVIGWSISAEYYIQIWKFYLYAFDYYESYQSEATWYVQQRIVGIEKRIETF